MVKTDAIDVGLLQSAGLEESLPSSSLNVNEYLPRNVYQLSKLAWSKAIALEFRTFVRRGGVFDYTKRGEKSIPIKNITELNHFSAEKYPK